MKRMFILILAMLMLTGMFVSAGALASDEDSSNLAILNVTQATEDEDYELQIEIENSYENAGSTSGYTVKLDNEKLRVLNIKETDADASGSSGEENAKAEKSNSADTGKSWVILVDVSTQGSDAGLTNLIKAMLNMMDSDDNVALVTTVQSNVDFLMSPKQNTLLNSVDNSTKKEFYDESAKYLYYAIVNTIDSLQACSDLKNDRRLIIISSGINTAKWQENASAIKVQQKIIDSGIVVYPVSCVNGGKVSSDYSALAELSETAAGRSISIDWYDTASIDTVIKAIEAHENTIKLSGNGGTKAKNTKFTLVVEQPEKRGKENALTVQFEGADDAPSITLADDFVYGEDGNFIVKLWNGLFRGLWYSYVIFAGIIVIIAVIVILIVTGKKKPAAEVTTPVFNGNGGETVVSELDQPSLRLQLSFRESNGTIHDAIMEPTGVTVGREIDNMVVLSADDRKISRHHFVINQKADKLFLTNISNTNSVSVNNMKINGPIELRQRDSIRVGDCTMTVTWNYR